MTDVDRRLVELAAQQHGVFSRAQARAAGLTASALHHRIERGQLVVCGTSTLRHPGAEHTWSGRLTAGLLDLGPGAIVTGLAAAQLRGLDGFDMDALAYLVPRSARNRRTIGTVVSASTISRLDWEYVEGFPCASGTRLVIDLLRTATPEQAGDALDSACRKRLTAIPVVQRRLGELGRRGRAGVAAFERLITVGAVESWLERRFVQLVRRAGLPEPELQARHQLPGVGVARVDFEFTGWGIVVEVGGQRGYLSLDERRRKERRRNALQLEGKVIYFFTREDVVDDPTYVVGTLATAVGAQQVTQDRLTGDPA